jgi:hypothetical protein
MTSNDPVILAVEYEGVLCKSDAGVYGQGYENELHFMSIYGAPQQTKAIFSALAASKELQIGEEQSRLRNILSRQRIPYDPHDLGRIEKLLVEHGYLTALESWGSIAGYACDFNDDAICDLILAEIYHSKNLKVA